VRTLIFRGRPARPGAGHESRLIKKVAVYPIFIAIAVGAIFSACSENTAPVSEPPTPQTPPSPPSPHAIPDHLAAVGATEFTATAGSALEQGPAVRVLDENERPVGGVSVTFSPVPSKVVVSDADGIARVGAWPVNTLAGQHFIVATVTVTESRELSLVFHLTVTPGPLAHFTILNGNNQAGRPRKPLPNQLYVRATDIYGNRLSGVPVAFSVVSGGGTIETSSTTTNVLGVATSGQWILGESNPQRASARTGQFEAQFEARLCETDEQCDLVPLNLAYVRDGSVWINTADGPLRVASDARRPAWSPDGSLLAFFRVNADREDIAICIASVPSLATKCAAVDRMWWEVAPEMRASWAPDGRSLALSRVYYNSGNLPLLFLDVGTMTIHQHGVIDGSVWSAGWSSDGTKMAIATDAKVYLANEGGSAVQVLLSYPIWELTWMPSGQKISMLILDCDLVASCWGEGIMLLDAKTRELEEVPIPETGKLRLSGLTWSSDGTRLAYSGLDPYSNMSEIRIHSTADSSTIVVLTNASDPSWHPLISR
jgi:hypothetical protein